MTKAFTFGVWYPMKDAPKVELPNWIIVTDGKHSVPAFWCPAYGGVSEWYPEGGSWELLFAPQDSGEEAMGELTRFMVSPKLPAL